MYFVHINVMGEKHLNLSVVLCCDFKGIFLLSYIHQQYQFICLDKNNLSKHRKTNGEHCLSSDLNGIFLSNTGQYYSRS